MVGHGLRPIRRAHLLALLEGASDGGVVPPPTVAQESAVHRVPNQRVREEVAGFRPLATPEDQSRSGELVERRR